MSLQPSDHLRHHLSGAFARESVAYCLILPEHGLMGHWYTWVNDKDEAGFAFVLHGEGPEPVFFSSETGLPAEGQNFDDWHLGRVNLKVGEPLMTARADFSSEELSVEFEFQGIHPAFDYGSNQEGTPSYLAQNRYEQGGRIVGQLRWGDRVLDFDGPGHRDHSWGTRDWDAIHHYKWIAAAGDKCSANVMLTLAEGEVDTNGYVFRDGVQSPIVKASIATVYGEGFVHDELTVICEDESGRTTTLELPHRHTLARWDVIPTFNFTDTCFTGSMEGEPVQAYVEYTWPRAYLDHLLAR